MKHYEIRPWIHNKFILFDKNDEPYEKILSVYNGFLKTEELLVDDVLNEWNLYYFNTQLQALEYLKEFITDLEMTMGESVTYSKEGMECKERILVSGKPKI